MWRLSEKLLTSVHRSTISPSWSSLGTGILQLSLKAFVILRSPRKPLASKWLRSRECISSRGWFGGKTFHGSGLRWRRHYSWNKYHKGSYYLTWSNCQQKSLREFTARPTFRTRNQSKCQYVLVGLVLSNECGYSLAGASYVLLTKAWTIADH